MRSLAEGGCVTHNRKMYLMNHILFVLIVVQLVLEVSYGQRSKQFFRKDYKYLEATRSFYKIHTMHRTWKEAKNICAGEGATFFFPEDQNEADTVMGYMNNSTTFWHVYIGVSDLIAETVFVTIDGRPILDVYNKWAPNEPNNANDNEDCVIIRRDGSLNDDSCTKSFPFICKKTLDSLEWNQRCNMPNLDYVYNEPLGRCYKFHSAPVNWTDAYALCNTEQSYLAVINSQKEADNLVALTAAQAPKKKSGSFVKGAVHLGFHNQLDDGWTTVKETSLEDSGYDIWAAKQPDGSDRERCGSMSYDGRLHDIGCDEKAFYICEHEVDILANILDERFSDD